MKKKKGAPPKPPSLTLNDEGFNILNAIQYEIDLRGYFFSEWTPDKLIKLNEMLLSIKVKAKGFKRQEISYFLTREDFRDDYPQEFSDGKSAFNNPTDYDYMIKYCQDEGWLNENNKWDRKVEPENTCIKLLKLLSKLGLFHKDFIEKDISILLSEFGIVRKISGTQRGFIVVKSKYSRKEKKQMSPKDLKKVEDEEIEKAKHFFKKANGRKSDYNFPPKKTL